MFGSAIAIAVVLLLVSFPLWLAARGRLGHMREKRDEGLARLAEVVRSAEATNEAFFRSLELVQKNLESLLARAESAEQRLRNLMLQPGTEKKERYTAAALLLAEGQPPERVASMLNLPLPQVEVVRDLQRIAGRGKVKAAPPRTAKEPPAEIEERSKFAGWEKSSPQPIAVVEAIRNAARRSPLAGAAVPRLDGLSV
ncbi:MAG TPA: hypothetical protein VNN77_10460 [candidate division Zixibacteria bacterium]|nr:hypothetical protein [candidate division Zixibacteria bacterium]